PNNPPAPPRSNPNFDYTQSPPTLRPGGAAPGPNNMGNVWQAWADRHNLARDIFARLIIATGALAEVDASGNVRLPQITGLNACTLTTSAGLTVSGTDAEYNALRYLAQVAVNIVDYIDKDDV